MPLYEYKCNKCGKTSEFLESANKGNISRKCPHCGKSSLEKLLSIPTGMIMRNRNNSFQRTDTCCGSTNTCNNPKRCCGG